MVNQFNELTGFQYNGGEIFMGVTRNSMKTNLLIQKTQLGNIKKTTFNSKPESFIYGMPKNPDPEGAREVTLIWKEHQANPDDQPGPDFLQMNKLAAMRGVTKTTQLHGFRAANNIALKKGEAVKKPPPPLPSDYNPQHTYGRPTAYKSAEEIRASGAEDPMMTPLIQYASQLAWVRANARRAHEFDVKKNYIKASDTKCTEMHARAVQDLISPPPPKSVHAFKISKFSKVGTKLDTRRSKSPVQSYSQPAITKSSGNSTHAGEKKEQSKHVDLTIDTNVGACESAQWSPANQTEQQ